MITNCCLTLPGVLPLPRCCSPVLSICRMVVVLAALVLAVILALRGHPPQVITGPALVLLAGAAAAAERPVFGHREQSVSALHSL